MEVFCLAQLCGRGARPLGNQRRLHSYEFGVAGQLVTAKAGSSDNPVPFFANMADMAASIEVDRLTTATM